MKYQEIRNQVKSGDLLLYQGTSFYSWVVRYFTGSSYSHVGIALWMNDRLMVLEALPPKVRLVPASISKPDFWIGVNTQINDEAMKFALSTVGQEYSYPDAFRAWLGISPSHNLKWQCVELIYKFYQWCRLPIALKRLTPQALLNWVMLHRGTDIHLIEEYK